jgi:hypothetical protein
MLRISSKFCRFDFSNIQKLRRTLAESDPFIYNVIMAEKERQITGINLIAS